MTMEMAAREFQLTQYPPTAAEEPKLPKQAACSKGTEPDVINRFQK